MSAVKIDITAEDQDTANAVTAAVQLGLTQGGFTNVAVSNEALLVSEPENLLAALQASAPEIFASPIVVEHALVLPNDGEEELAVLETEELDDIDA